MAPGTHLKKRGKQLNITSTDVEHLCDLEQCDLERVMLTSSPPPPAISPTCSCCSCQPSDPARPMQEPLALADYYRRNTAGSSSPRSGRDRSATDQAERPHSHFSCSSLAKAVGIAVGWTLATRAFAIVVRKAKRSASAVDRQTRAKANSGPERSRELPPSPNRARPQGTAKATNDVNSARCALLAFSAAPPAQSERRL